MQLTKDDVKTGNEIQVKLNLIWKDDGLENKPYGKEAKKKHIDFSKFQQVRKFYEKYKDTYELFAKEIENYINGPIVSLPVDDETTLEEFCKMWRDWLFDYCFVDELNVRKG